MKLQKILVLALALAGSALILTAQDQGAPPQGNPPDQGLGGPGGPGRPGPRGRRLPIHPLMKALDANGDGTIDEQEIANAVAALKTLDKNGDGKLTPDELRPPFPPPGQHGPGGPGFGPPPDGQPGDEQGQGQRPPPNQ